MQYESVYKSCSKIWNQTEQQVKEKNEPKNKEAQNKKASVAHMGTNAFKQNNYYGQ